MSQGQLPWAKEVFYYGKPSALPEKVLLHAGNLSMIYESGNIRMLKSGHIELIRMIYSAVRDQNWNTLDSVISNEKIVQNDQGFTINYHAEYGSPAVFQANYLISANHHNELTFAMDGLMLNRFRRNRIGFCILHPIEECAGQTIKITHSKGETEVGIFPVLISPNQPFKDIRSMQWTAADKMEASISFEGDIFEMEDQRNWTDASYKTYCTPLELAFPLEIQKGERIYQELKFNLLTSVNPISLDSTSATSIVLQATDKSIKLPAIGIGHSSSEMPLEQNEEAYLKKLKFEHYRLDIHLDGPKWKTKFSFGLEQAILLDLPLELCVHLAFDDEKTFLAFLTQLKESKANIKYMTLFESDKKCSSDDFVKKYYSQVKAVMPKIHVGSGTDAYFTELNRERLNPELLDFLTYSVNPQVHAFDNQSLCENFVTQKYTVQSARHFAKKAAIHVTPVTLKKRFNPDATTNDAETAIQLLPDNVDPRQMSLFAAGWTLGSIQSLADAGTNLVTYFETKGMRGIMQGNVPNTYPSLFFSEKDLFFPVFAVFYDLGLYKDYDILRKSISDPIKITALSMRKGNMLVIMLANLTNKQQEILVSPIGGNKVKVRSIDENNVKAFMKEPLHILQQFEEKEITNRKLLMELLPFSYTVIEGAVSAEL
jgi:D-apionolactonase